jgi:protease secretion system membrane fusion protein
MKNWLKKIQQVADSQPVDGENMQTPSTDINKVVRFGIATLVLGFGGFMLWAALAPLDEGVPASGVVIVDSKRKAVQHLHGGIVEKILVRDGDLVKANQPLIKLDQTQIAGEFSTVQTNYWQLQAMYDRLMAEQNRAGSIKFAQKLLDAAASSPKAKEIIDSQQQLFETRRAALANQRSILAQAAAGGQEQVRGLQSLEESRRKQIALLEKDLNGLRDLVQEGYAPRTRLLEMERMLAQLNGDRGSTLADIERATRSIAEAKLRGMQVEQEFLKEVDTQLSQVQSDLNRWRNELRTTEEAMARSVLRAPTEGHVVGLMVHTEGGVIRPGDVLMEIVPEDDQLVIEAHLPTHLIDKVYRGLKAEIRFAGLGTSGKVPVLHGDVNNVSADSTVDQRGFAYYVARVHVDRESLDALSKQNLKIQPGMPAEIVVRTGERSLLDYLIRPLLNHIAPAMKEH